MKYIFVYGSLLRGEHNFTRFLATSKLKGEYLTKELFVMYGKDNPFPLARKLVPKDNAWFAGHIRGELYHVTPDNVRRLDNLEGHPDFFERRITKLEGVVHKDVWMYHWAGDGHIDNSLLTPNIAKILDWKQQSWW